MVHCNASVGIFVVNMDRRRLLQLRKMWKTSQVLYMGWLTDSGASKSINDFNGWANQCGHDNDQADTVSHYELLVFLSYEEPSGTLNMITTKEFKKLYNAVRMSQCDPKLFGKAQVAIIAGPAIIVEMIVKAAVVDSGIPMDWNYCGGRGAIWTKKESDIKACRHHLMMNIPTTNLTVNDI